MNYEFKKSGLAHKDLVNFQFEVLNLKCGTAFYQRQCGVTKRLLQNFTYEELLSVLVMFKEVGLPKTYKSIYFLEKNDTRSLIDIASIYFKYKKEEKKKVREDNLVNERNKRIGRLEFDL